MLYDKIYKSLINNCISNKDKIIASECYEIHHIIPRCLGGTDDPTNLVYMSVRQHIMAHLLLLKLYPNNEKIIFAANAMLFFKNKQGERSSVINKNFSIRTITKIRENFLNQLRKNGIILKDGKIIFKAKTVLCIDDNGKIIRLFSPINLVKSINLSPSSVGKCCRSKELKKYAGYFWRYLEDYKKEFGEDNIIEYQMNLNMGIVPKIDLSYSNLNNNERLKARKVYPRTKEWSQKISKSNKGKKKNTPKEKTYNKGTSKKVKDFNGNTYASIKIASEKIGICEKTLRKWIKEGKGYYFVEDSRIISKEENIIFTNLTECSNYYNVSKTTIIKWIKDQNKQIYYLNK